MQRFIVRRALLLDLSLAALVASSAASTASAAESAHVHGLVKVDVAIDAKTLTVQLEAPLDSLLGFEHRPRTVAEKQAADALLKRMKAGGTGLVRPEPAALCKPSDTTVESAALQPAASAAGTAAGDDAHADLDAGFEFVCDRPEKLTSIEFGLFDAFERLQKIEVRVAGSTGQSKRTLLRPDKLLRLRP